MSHDEIIQFCLRIAASGVVGGAIGLERSIHGRDAGLRTHAMVSMGSAIFMILSELVAKHSIELLPHLTAVPDPGRIGAQIVTGIGFLGAGAIIKSGVTIRGLTTASCLWLVASLGMLCGAGYLGLALGSTGMAILALVLLKHVEHWFPSNSYRFLRITLKDDEQLPLLINTIKACKINLMHVNFAHEKGTGITTLDGYTRIFHRGLTDKVYHQLKSDVLGACPSVQSISWRK